MFRRVDPRTLVLVNRNSTVIAAAALAVAGSLLGVDRAAADPATPAPAPTTDAPTPTGPAPGPTGHAAGPAGIGPAPGPSPAPLTVPANGPLTAIDKDGLYAVGSGVVPGTYASAGPVEGTKCYWKRSAADGSIIDNALSGKPQVVTIEATDATFKTSGCQIWQLTDQAPPPENSPQMSQWQLRQYLNNLNSLAGQSGNGQLPPF